MRTLLAITILVGLSARAGAETDRPDDSTNKPTEDDKTAMAVKKALEEDRKVRRAQEDADLKVKQEREVAEAAYQKEAVTFRDFLVATVSNNGVTSVGSGTVAYRNGRKLSTDEFYEAVERPDLAATYRRRTKIGKTVAWGGVLVSLAASTYGLFAASKSDNCDIGSPDFSACSDRRSDARLNNLIWTSSVTVGGLVVSLVGVYILAKRQPSSMNENHDMADAHNAKLRKKHRLPTAVAPYATPDGGGLAMVGRF
jgi:hypothetical protein